MARALGQWAAVAALLALALAGSGAAQPSGSYLGCYKTAMMAGVKQMQNVGGMKACVARCGAARAPMAAVTKAGGCACVTLVPGDDAAAISDASCSGGGASALFYIVHPSLAGQRCRVANVAFDPSNFDVAYSADKISWSSANNSMTMRMEGQDGTRLATKDGMHQYGTYQVRGLINGVSGVVSAFYTRSSDEYNAANSGDFHEIDVEFLNGNPAKPHTLWFNSFYKGYSGGERPVPVAEYVSKLGLPKGASNSNTWLTYSFNWQPSHVTWFVNGVPFVHKYYNQNVTWTDMKGAAHSKIFRPPTDASHVVFSLWSDIDQKRGFGGILDWGKSPYYSSFADLRRVLCDPSADGPAAAPAWAGSASRPKPSTDQKQPPAVAPRPTKPRQPVSPVVAPAPAKPAAGHAAAGPAHGGVSAAAGPCAVKVGAWQQCGGVGGLCARIPGASASASCGRRAWQGACCPAGFTCKAQTKDSYYWICSQ